MPENSPTTKPAQLHYLDMAHAGKAGWWRYLLGLFSICGGYILFTTVFYVIYIVAISLAIANDKFLKHPPATAAQWRQFGLDPIIDYVGLNLTFLGLLLLIYLVIRIVHQRSFLSLITAGKNFDWRRLFFGFGVWFLLAAIESLAEYLVFRHDYAMGRYINDLWKYVPLVLVLTPLQCLAEELLCRGYFMQGLSVLVSKKWLLIMISGLFFMLPHLGNPEMAEDPLVVSAGYLAIGIILGAVAIKAGSLEIGIGAHIANNLFSLLLNSEDSALQVPSLFLCLKPHPHMELLTLIAAGIIFYLATGYYVKTSQQEAHEG